MNVSKIAQFLRCQVIWILDFVLLKINTDSGYEFKFKYP